MRDSAGDASFGRQVLRRYVNDRICDGAEGGGQMLELFCECGGRRCADRVRLSADEYAAARAVPGRLVVAASHAGAGAGAEELVVLEQGPAG
jgi:hypothetical protein